MKKTRVTRNGQVTVPKEIRERLGIRTGTVLRVEAEGDAVVCRPVTRLEDLAGSLAHVATVEEAKRDLDRTRGEED